MDVIFFACVVALKKKHNICPQFKYIRSMNFHIFFPRRHECFEIFGVFFPFVYTFVGLFFSGIFFIQKKHSARK